MPIILYALQAISPSVSILISLDLLIDREIWKIFKTGNNAYVKFIRSVLQLHSIHHLLHMRVCSFVMNYVMKENLLSALVMNRVGVTVVRALC
jgi:hypothetical protein